MGIDSAREFMSESCALEKQALAAMKEGDFSLASKLNRDAIAYCDRARSVLKEILATSLARHE